METKEAENRIKNGVGVSVPKMGTGETETLTQTLDSGVQAQEDGARVSVPEMGAEGRETLTETLDSAVQTQEYGARVSIGGDEGAKDDVYVSGDAGVVIETSVVETEISVDKSFVCSNEGDGVFIEDAKETGVAAVEGSVDGDSTEDGCCKGIGLDLNVGSVVEVDGSLDSVNENGESCGNVDNGGSVAENEGNTGEKFIEISDAGVVIETRVVETKISVENSFVCSSGSYGGFIGDAKETGGAAVEGLADGDSTLLNGDGCCQGIGLDQNVGSVAEVDGSLGSVNEKGENCGYVDNGGSVAENEGNLGEKLIEISNPEGKGKDEANCSGEENDGEGEEDAGDEERDYSVGEFVWGKIRSHPWWPGRIYDPKDASEYARKYSKQEKLLVAYFGDESFSWCSPSQLKPFAEDFEEMSGQSISKSFVTAVQNAVDEMGKLVELKMTCHCTSDKVRIGFDRHAATNAGIKEGVLVPDCDVDKLLVLLNGPTELLSTLRSTAESLSIPGLLVFTVLRSWLLAFYRAKGGHKLPMYYGPVSIEGLEDKNGNVGVTDEKDFSGVVQVPFGGPAEEVWISLPVHQGLGEANQSFLQKCPGIAEGKLYVSRKKKTDAELTEEDMFVKPDNAMESLVKDVTTAGKLVKTSVEEKRKSSDEVVSRDGIDLSSPSGKKRGRGKRSKTEGSVKSQKNKVLVAKNGGSDGEEETKDGVSGPGNEDTGAKEETGKDLASGRKKRRRKMVDTQESSETKVLREKHGGGEGEEGTIKDSVSGVGNERRKAKEKTDKGLASRERKKSRYLSPPFTNLKSGVRNSSTEKDSLGAESEKIARVARIGERMISAAGQIIGSLPVVNCSDETNVGTVAISTPKPPRDDQKKIIDSSKLNALSKEVVAEVRSAAINPLHFKEKSAVDMLSEFISEFRSALHLKGSNYKIFHRGQPGRKRKLPSSGPDTEIPESKSPRKRNGKKEQELSGMKKLEKDGGGLGKKRKEEETTDNKNDADAATTPVRLIVTFPPGFSLPSKNDLKAVFSKFGALNETETDVLYNCSCAMVVYVKNSDAEKAFNASLKASPFGPAKVSYRLRYYLDGFEKAASPSKEGGENLVDDASRVLFTVKEKLGLMTSMLEKSDGNMLPEVQSKLEVEIKGLLEVVNTVT